jgi:citrate lyase subunit beta/citryl-CoA lyase
MSDVQVAVDAIDAAASSRGDNPLPLHVLVESPAAVHQVFSMASHPRVESISFGLMDFVSAHGGAIPGAAMAVRAEGDATTLDQFSHPLVARAKLEISSACHANRKVPSHCVVTEFRDMARLKKSASMAARMFGYTRMWSIHPDQIRPILEAFSPDAAEIDLAVTVTQAGAAQEWAPVAVQGKLHDRASYRYYWHVLERAHQTGCILPGGIQAYFGQSFH